MKIHSIKGKNKFCGPAVVAALTGVSTDLGAAAIRKRSFQEFVKGTFTIHLLMTLLDFGLSHFEHRGFNGMTLAQFFKASASLRKGGRVFLVIAGDHFQLVKGNKFICGITKELVGFSHEKVKRRARVAEVFEITGKATLPAFPHPCSEKATSDKARARSLASSARVKAKKLAAEHGMRIEIEEIEGGRHYWVFAKRETEKHQDYPFEGDHIVYDWEEALNRVEDIIAFEASIPHCDPHVAF